MSQEFFTQEIGSLAKPEWRVKAVAAKPITMDDVVEASIWGQRLHLDADPLLELLTMASIHTTAALSEENKNTIRFWSTRFATRLQEKAGLDIVYDGEQNRSEMYEHAMRRSAGFASRGLVRAFDNKYYHKFACVDHPHVTAPWHVDELLTLQKLTKKTIKVPITGPYTLAAWSYDEHFASRREFILGVARSLLRPNIQALIDAGATWIQIDEPAATTVPDEVPLMVEAFNEATRGFDCTFSVHICFSDYSQLFPHIIAMEQCSQYSLEFANRDSHDLGIHHRPAYDLLKKFNEYGVDAKIGLGVVDIHSDFIESPELIRDRILYATEVLGDPTRINPSPDCGLRTRTWDVAFAKLSAVVEGARLAAATL